MRKIILTISMGLICALSIAEPFKAASYNIHMSPDGKFNAWQARKTSVGKLVRYHDFDIFGTQEGFLHQIKDVVGDDGIYEYVATGREDGKEEGETSAIIFKKDRFELLDSGSFWFAETPDKAVKGWDADCKRICTWGKFKDKKDGSEFFFFSCHFDHRGVEARRNSAKLYIDKIEEITKGAPFVGVGDFNAAPQDEPIKIILSSPKIKDARAISKTPPYGPRRTWNAYNPDEKRNPERIDYIFVSPNVEVLKHGVLTDLLSDDDSADYGNHPEPQKLGKSQRVLNPSDHFPVEALLEIK